MKKIRAIIIDDMPLAIASLKADLEDVSEVEIVGEANGVLAGAKLVRKENPDLIFLDIHMGDGDRFDLLEIIEKGETQVIFTTASKDHAIQAFRFHAVDYLLKPVDTDLLRKAIDKVLSRISEPSSADSTDLPKTIALNTQEEIRIVSISDIIRLESMGNYTTFHLDGSRNILVTKTMGEFEKILGDNFMRVHQSHLVHKHHIHAYIKSEGGYIKMKDDSDVPVSVRKKSLVIETLKER